MCYSGFRLLYSAQPPPIPCPLLQPKTAFSYSLCFSPSQLCVCVLISVDQASPITLRWNPGPSLWICDLSGSLIIVTGLLMANHRVPCLSFQGHISLSFPKDLSGFQLTYLVAECPRQSLERDQPCSVFWPPFFFLFLWLTVKGEVGLFLRPHMNSYSTFERGKKLSEGNMCT